MQSWPGCKTIDTTGRNLNWYSLCWGQVTIASKIMNVYTTEKDLQNIWMGEGGIQQSSMLSCALIGEKNENRFVHACLL